MSWTKVTSIVAMGVLSVLAPLTPALAAHHHHHAATARALHSRAHVSHLTHLSHVAHAAAHQVAHKSALKAAVVPSKASNKAIAQTASTAGLSAAAAIVIDADSGQVLFDRNSHAHRAPASTTKIMTSLLAVESGKLDDVVTISKHAASVGESSAGLKEGEKLTLRQLLYGVLLPSGNDASTAVAEYLGGGSEEKFVEMMNKRAQELGMKDTHFANPHGLPCPDHYSCAADLATLLRTAEKQPEWLTISSTKTKILPYADKPTEGRMLKNHNKLLWSYPYAEAGKTGYTNAAGRCFVGSAHKGNRRVIEAVLGAPNLWEDCAYLLNYGLDKFENVVVARKGEVVGTVPIQSGYSRVVEVVAPRDVMVSLPRGTADKANLQQVWQLPDELTAPIDENQPVGQLIVREGEKVLTEVPLVAAQSVPVGSSPWSHLSSWFFPGMLMASVLSLFRLQGTRRRKKRKARRVPSKPLPPDLRNRGGTGRLYKAS